MRFQDFRDNLNEAKLKAEDYEAAIVIGWHKNNGKKLDLSTSGINPATYKMLQKEKAALKSGELIAKAIAKHFGNKNAKAEQYGRAKSSLTKFWSSYGATDTTPKTDILIGNKRLSLKIGMAQLMSGGPAESKATFFAALKATPSLKNSAEFKKANKTSFMGSYGDANASRQHGKGHRDRRAWQVNQKIFDGRGRWKSLLTDENKAYVDRLLSSNVSRWVLERINYGSES